MKKMLQDYRKAINPPYAKRDLPVILLTLFLIVVLPLILIALSQQHRVKSSAAEPSWVLIGVNTYAATQGSTRGKIIHTLTSYQGKLFMGYGDATANTGPIYINYYDPTTNVITYDHLLATEEIELYKDVNSRLYVPVIDRKGTTISYSVGMPWNEPTFSGADSEHNYDVATYTGSDLWLSTSHGYGRIWRSQDNGSTWSNVYTSANVCQTSSGTRFRFIGVYHNKVYIQGHDINSSSVWCAHPRSKVFDGTKWADGPDLLPRKTEDMGFRPTVFADRMIYRSLPYFDPTRHQNLLVFDGTSVSTPFGKYIYDFAVDGTTVYVLAEDGSVSKSTDLVSWTQATTTAPSTARSLALLNGVIYVGTTDSSLYAFTDPTTVTPMPSPTPTTGPTPTVTPTPLPAGSNILLNSSFELNNSGIPANWTRSVWDTADFHSGVASARLDGGGDNYAWQAPVLKPSTTYTLQGWIKTSGLSSTDYGAELRYAVTTGTSSVNRTQLVKGTTDWTFVTTTFTTPGDFGGGRLDLHFAATSGTTPKAWFDEVALCEGSCPTDTTVVVSTPVPTMVSGTSTPVPTRTPTPTLIPSSDTTKPTVSITSPINGSTVPRRGKVDISANASDNVAVDHVTFTTSDGNSSTSFTAPYTYTWSVPNAPGKSYTITATAYDTSNNSSSTPVRVTSNR